MKVSTIALVSLVLVLVLISGCAKGKAEAGNEEQAPATTQEQETPQEAEAPPLEEAEPIPEEYNPDINPEDFVEGVNNKYFTLTPRSKFTYRGNTPEGYETTEVYVTEETKTIMGVETMVVQETVWIEEEKLEEGTTWYAQDKDGNVWFFGEESFEIAGTITKKNSDSWEAGKGGAKPGMIMLGSPEVGNDYLLEYIEGKIEDWAQIMDFGSTITVQYGKFENCLHTKEWTPLDSEVDQQKYFCPEVGALTLDKDLAELEQVALVNVEKDVDPTPKKPVETVDIGELDLEITEERAGEIALEEVPGEVIEVGIERKSGKNVYVVEVESEEGDEVDVLIDMDTGEVIGTET